MDVLACFGASPDQCIAPAVKHTVCCDHRTSPATGCSAGYVADKWQHAQQTGLFLSEDEARYYFRQFVTAVAYCHAHNVAHRCSSHITSNSQMLQTVLGSSKGGCRSAEGARAAVAFHHDRVCQ